MEKINLNDTIYFCLTEEGKKIVREHYNALCYGFQKEERKKEWQEYCHKYLEDTREIDGKQYNHLELWAFAAIFGKHFYQGNEALPCEMNVYLEKDFYNK